MNDKYQQEIRDFSKKFAPYKDKRIVLYGIGRYTATLTEGLTGFSIIGLMDKDPKNIGKELFGLPILSHEQVRNEADLIIINTAGSYWNLIYERIKDLGIPVYYRNGERAEERAQFDSNNPYWEADSDLLRKKIKQTDIVSFDFYGTLFLRAICSPKDVFDCMETAVGDIAHLPLLFSELRAKAVSRMPACYGLNDLYAEIRQLSGCSEKEIEQIKLLELSFEKEILIPRRMLLRMMQEAIESGKEVYLISDMYLPREFFQERLKEQGVVLDPDHIWVSCEKKAEKSDEGLWKLYKDCIIRNDKRALHIGDDKLADIKKPEEEGIQTYYVADTMSLLSMSSISILQSKMMSTYASAVAGLTLGRLWSDPFSLCHDRGRVRIKDERTMGYVVFGPVIVCFCEWLKEKTARDKVRRLVFMSRDGYFLEKDYQYYMQQLESESKTVYIAVSRQLAMTAAVETEQDLWDLIHMPWTGTYAELLEDRFGIQNANAKREEDLPEYMPQIKEKVQEIKNNYHDYVKTFDLSQDDAIVDLGYYGNNQRYLNRIAGTNMRGYYFNADCAEDNQNSMKQSMAACFQKTEDKKGDQSYILRYQMFLESFLTAPYGMVTEVDKNGKCHYKPDGKNQIFFSRKEEINEGVKEYIRDWIRCFGKMNNHFDIPFIDNWYEVCFNGSIGYSDEVKSSFYNDNAMMNRLESGVFG